jgi:hypothetical protein
MEDFDREYNEDDDEIVRAEHYPDNEDHQKFCNDVRAASYEPLHYNGRWFWSGPAVIADTVEEVTAVTDVDCIYDNMGLGYVIHPSSS